MTDKSDTPHFTQTQRIAFQRGFTILLALMISIVFLWMIRDFLGVLFLAGVLALILMPVQHWIQSHLGGRKKIAATLVLIAATLLFLIPLLTLIGLVVRQAAEVAQFLIPWVQEQITSFRENGFDGLPDWLPFRDAMAPYQQNLADQLANLAPGAGGFAWSSLTRATGGTMGFLLNTVILLFAMFMFLTRGDKMASQTVDLLPMPKEDRDLLVERSLSTIRATVKGTFVIAVIQGTLVGIGFAVAGLPGAVFWGVVTAVLSIIPLVGPPLVWGPAAIWLLVNGDYMTGGLLALYGAGFVGVLDNILRPILVGRDAKMSDLMVLLSTVGGLTLFGAIGIIIGPVIAALFTSVWFIYAKSYAPILQGKAKDLKDQEA